MRTTVVDGFRIQHVEICPFCWGAVESVLPSSPQDLLRRSVVASPCGHTLDMAKREFTIERIGATETLAE